MGRKGSRTKKHVEHRQSLPFFGLWMFHLMIPFLFIFKIGSGLRKYLYTRKFASLSRGGLMKIFDYKMYDRLTIRDDRLAQDILDELPFVSSFMLYLLLSFTSISRNIFLPSFKVKVYDNASSELERRASRTCFFDDVVKNSRESQVVFLGSQLDTRPYMFFGKRGRGSPLLYEVDHKQLLKFKKKVLKHSGAPMSHVVFVQCDLFSYEKDACEWQDALVAQGFDSRKSTLFVLDETIFSHRSEVSETLIGVISDILAKNKSSRVAFDYFDSAAITLVSLLMILFTRTLVLFGINGKSKSHKTNAENFIGQFSLEAEQHIRLEKLNYGMIVAKYLDKSSKKKKKTSKSKRRKKKRYDGESDESLIGRTNYLSEISEMSLG